jgi:hypothetical protein
MNLTWLTVDVDYQEGEDKSFSAEYTKQGNTYQLCLYLPFWVVQVKSRWEKE